MKEPRVPAGEFPRAVMEAARRPDALRYHDRSNRIRIRFRSSAIGVGAKPGVIVRRSDCDRDS
jgi:hypothetical protein